MEEVKDINFIHNRWSIKTITKNSISDRETVVSLSKSEGDTNTTGKCFPREQENIRKIEKQENGKTIKGGNQV